MAASYSTDLTTLTANETNAMVEPTATTPENWTYLNAFTSAETDYFIQGTACTSATMKVGIGGALTNNISFTMGTDDAVLCWAYLWCPANLDLEANAGVRQMIGSGTAAFYWVTHSGSDDWMYGGWRCFAMGKPDQITVQTVGSPNINSLAYTGWAAKMLAVPGKGNPFGVDAIRKGRCQIKVTGATGSFLEIEEFNSKNSTASRSGFTLIDSGYHRLGLFQYQNGAYLWKGKLLLGETGVASCTFSDSNKLIFVENTKRVTANFNLIEVQHASSIITLNGITIQALGTVSKGRLLVTDAATIDLDGCTFIDMDTFVFNASGTATVDTTIFRRCGLITKGNSVMTGCTFDKLTGTIGVTASSPANAALITNSTFISDGTGHGLEITGTAANMTLTNVTWSGYAASDGSTGNEAVYINTSAGSMNLTISGGSTPSIRVAAGVNVTVLSNAVNVTAKAVKEDGTYINGASVHVEAAAGGGFPCDATVTITNSGTTATVSHTGHAMATNDKVIIRGASLDANNGVFTITKINNDSYSYTMGSSPGSNPTGTIKSTFVVLNGTTTGSGEITMSRIFPSSQPVVGRIRKSSSAPYYKQANITGTVSSSTGAYFTGVMISDD